MNASIDLSRSELITMFMGIEEEVTITTLQPAVISTNCRIDETYCSELTYDKFSLTIIDVIIAAMLSVVRTNAPI